MANVFINFSGNICCVKSIEAIFAGARNPLFVASVDIVVVGLESRSLQAPEFSSAVIDRRASFGEGNAANPGRSSEVPSLSLDVHDPRLVSHTTSLPDSRFPRSSKGDRK